MTNEKIAHTHTKNTHTCVPVQCRNVALGGHPACRAASTETKRNFARSSQKRPQQVFPWTRIAFQSSRDFA